MTREVIFNNKVNQSIKFAVPVVEEVVTSKRYKISEKYYNTKGDIIESMEYKKGQLTLWEIYKFNDTGNLIEKIWHNCNGYDKTKFKHFSEKYTYSEEKNDSTESEIESIVSEDGKRIDTTYYLNGKIESKSTYSANSIIEEMIEYKKETISRISKFDNRGNLLKIDNFDAKGLLLNFSSFEYDDKNNQIRITKTSRTGYLTQDRKLSYDNNNNLIEDVDASREFIKIHNDFNQTLIGEPDFESKESYKHQYKYSDKQLLQEEKLFLSEKLIMIYQFEYKHFEK